MAYSIQRVTSDGTLDTIAISFAFKTRDTIKVFVGGFEVTTGWSWASPTEDTIIFDSPIPVGVEVIVRRISDLTRVDHIFGYRGDGSGNAAFNSDSMDDNFEQTMWAAQEVQDANELTQTSAETARQQALLATEAAEAAAESAVEAAASAASIGDDVTESAANAAAALASKTAAEAAATSATGSATSAANSASAAAGYLADVQADADAAAASASAASTSATNASDSATAAGISASAAAASATDASGSAANAADSATAAAVSEGEAEGVVVDLNKVYLGPKASAPTVDNNGDPLQSGALYFNTANGVMWVYNGTDWVVAASAIQGIIAKPTTPVVATAGQTSVTIPTGYDAGYINVFVNGVLIEPPGVTATNGTDVVFTTALEAGDEVTWVAFGAFTVADTYTKGEADTLLAAKADTDSVYSKSEVDSAVGAVQAEVTTLDGEVDFTIIYPNGGTAASPASVVNGSRYVEANPFAGHYVLCVAQVLVGGVWGESGWYTDDAAGVSRAFGTKCAFLNENSLVVQTGRTGVLTIGDTSGGAHGGPGSPTSLPCRVLVWKLKGAI